LIATFTGIAQRFAAVKPDVAQYIAHCDEAARAGLELPLALQARRVALTALEFVRHQKFEEFGEHLVGDAVAALRKNATSDINIKEFLLDVVEKALVKVAPAGGRYALTSEELQLRLFGFATIVVSKSLVGGVRLTDFTLLRDALQATSQDTLASVVKLAADSLEKLDKLPETSLLGGVLRSQSWLKMSPALSKEFQRSQSSAVKRTVLSDLTVAVHSLSGTPNMSTAELKSKLGTVFDYINTLQGDHNDLKTYRSTLSMLIDWGYSLVKVSDDYLAKAIDFMIKPAAVTMVSQACLCAAICLQIPVLAKGVQSVHQHII